MKTRTVWDGVGLVDVSDVNGWGTGGQYQSVGCYKVGEYEGLPVVRITGCLLFDEGEIAKAAHDVGLPCWLEEEGPPVDHDADGAR